MELDRLLTGRDDLAAGEGKLLSALNEIKALLTPARWAYRPLRAQADFGKANQFNLDEGDGVSIAQRLNTAELNITALAFFFLCAPRVRNPLRMLIFDDPLQNMDEMTVTTVARAFAKLMALWDTVECAREEGAPPWRILLLLHGHDDVERFRNEVPCALYRLPWLRPTGGSKPENYLIEPEPGTLTSQVQDLGDVIGEP